jgi:hypothetical protein
MQTMATTRIASQITITRRGLPAAARASRSVNTSRVTP